MNAVDTNIFVYSISVDDPVRRAAATALISSLNPAETVLLWQVASEFTAAATKHARQGRLLGKLDDVVRSVHGQFPLVVPRPRVLTRALEIHLGFQVSYWDAALIAACSEAGVKVLYSEDLQSAPVIDGVRIVSPFA